MKYDKIKSLIEQFEQFEQESGTDNINAFAYWLNSKVNSLHEDEGKGEEQYLDNQIAQAFSMLSNHTKHYVKTAIKGSPLVGWNDFVMMVVLFYKGSMRKTAVIQRSLLELSPGIEVIKRLLRANLIEEFNDPDDGRAKRVKLTTSGVQLVKTMQSKMDTVSKIITGNLTLQEKKQMLPILSKLVHFHEPIFKEDLGSELEVILEKYVRTSQ